MGIYSVSVKVYTLVKTILASVITVSIPRMAAISGSGNEKLLINTAKEIYDIVVSAVFPALTGLIVLSREIVVLISNETYLEATISLQLLSTALVFCLTGYFWAQCVLYAFKKEKIVLVGTMVSAIINIVLNFIFIPIWKQNAAAFTTVISEMFTAGLFCYYGKKEVHISGVFKTTAKVICGCLGIVIVCFVAKRLLQNYILRMIVAICTSVVTYGAIEFLLKNDAVWSIIKDVRSKLSCNLR